MNIDLQIAACGSTFGAALSSNLAGEISSTHVLNIFVPLALTA